MNIQRTLLLIILVGLRTLLFLAGSETSAGPGSKFTFRKVVVGYGKKAIPAHLTRASVAERP